MVDHSVDIRFIHNRDGFWFHVIAESFGDFLARRPATDAMVTSGAFDVDEAVKRQCLRQRGAAVWALSICRGAIGPAQDAE